MRQVFLRVIGVLAALAAAGLMTVVPAAPAAAAISADIQVIGGPAPTGAVGSVVEIRYKFINHGPDAVPDKTARIDWVAPVGTQLVGDFSGPGWHVVVPHRHVWTYAAAMPVQDPTLPTPAWSVQQFRIDSPIVVAGLLSVTTKIDPKPGNNSIALVITVAGESPSPSTAASTTAPSSPTGTPAAPSSPAATDTDVPGLLAGPSDDQPFTGDPSVGALVPAPQSSGGLDVVTLAAAGIGGGLVVAGSVVLALVWRHRQAPGDPPTGY